MKFTLSWLKDYLETDADLGAVSDRLTSLGLEVESITDRSGELAPFLIAEIREAKPHPNADKLQVCRVFDGRETLQIVCGAPNARTGLKVVLAPIGTVIPAGEFTIRKSNIRDVESCGMLCSSAELGLGDDAAGIIELPANAPVGQQAAPFMGWDDPVIEIAVTPNRGDCLGVYGIARDLAASGLGKLKPLPNHESRITNHESRISVSIENTEVCPLFLGCCIKGVKNGESPEWLRRRLQSVGAKPISALVDITNYLSLSYNRPAHVFDADKLSGNVIVRSAKNGETFTGLDEKEYTLSKGMTVIADAKGVQALGGVLGGLASGVTFDTTNVFVEIALFDPITIAKAGRALQIDSDARHRFERWVDPGFAEAGMALALALIEDICGGEAGKVVRAGEVPDARKKIDFNVGLVRELLGIEIEEAAVVEFLEAVGCEVSGRGGAMAVITPTWRNDLNIPQDLVEEVARLYGYDNIPADRVPLPEHTTLPLTKTQRRRFDMTRALAARGLQEVVSYSFLSSQQAAAFRGGNDNEIRVENPISADLDVMRPSIVPNLLAAHQRNAARGMKSSRFFEVGPAFSGDQPGQQQRVAAGIRAGEAFDATPHMAVRPVDAFDAKADALTVIGEALPVGNLTVTRETPSYYHPGRSGALTLGKNVLAYFGELHPAVAKSFDIRENIVAFEVFLDTLPQPKEKAKAARPKLELANFQAVNRDFAFEVDEKTEAQTILIAVRKAEKQLVQNAAIFDVYQGKGVAEGKKSVALSVRLQPKDKTLTDDEIEAVCRKIIQSVQQATGGTLRDGR